MTAARAEYARRYTDQRLRITPQDRDQAGPILAARLAAAPTRDPFTAWTQTVTAGVQAAAAVAAAFIPPVPGVIVAARP